MFSVSLSYCKYVVNVLVNCNFITYSNGVSIANSSPLTNSIFCVICKLTNKNI